MDRVRDTVPLRPPHLTSEAEVLDQCNCLVQHVLCLDFRDPAVQVQNHETVLSFLYVEA
ncbi:MAG: hypothetical protein M3Z24_11280 [Chloroflexota bacterium]|nr:hypothetical protein [Chloroflexota bacterium]